MEEPGIKDHPGKVGDCEIDFLTLFKIEGLKFWCCAGLCQPCEFYHCLAISAGTKGELQFIGYILDLSFIVRLLNSNSLGRNSQRFLEWNRMTCEALLTFTDKTKTVLQYWFWWISLVFAEGPFSLNAHICLCTFLLLPNAPSFGGRGCQDAAVTTVYHIWSHIQSMLRFT